MSIHDAMATMQDSTGKTPCADCRKPTSAIAYGVPCCMGCYVKRRVAEDAAKLLDRRAA